MTIQSFSEEDTYELGRKIGEKAKPGDVFCLDGELGAGKTVFVKGFCDALGVSADVSSPTFTTMNCYAGGRLEVYHFDVYRISSYHEMDDSGFDDFFYGKGVCLIEWAENIAGLLPDTAVRISFERDYEKGDDYRAIKISTELKL